MNRSSVTDNLPTTQPADMAISRAWAARAFSHPADLPISFVLGGQTLRGIPDAWQPSVEQRRIDAVLTETVFSAIDPATGLHVRVECTEYHDYPVVEWVAWLTNHGLDPTPVVRDLRAMDLTVEGAAPVLVHCNGDFYSAEGYAPRETPLDAGTELAFTPNG